MDATVATVILAFLFLASAFWYLYQRPGPLNPPGPRGLPLLGNILDMPSNYPWLTYSKWAATHGDIVYITTLGGPIVIINSAKVATDLFEGRSLNYADRPAMAMLVDLMKWDWDVGKMPYSDRWRQHRKALHDYFKPKKVHNYHAVQKEAVDIFIQQITDTPELYADHTHFYAASVILKVIYGYEMLVEDDPYLKIVRAAGEGLVAATNVGSFAIDYIPALKYVPAWFPGASFRNKAKKWAEAIAVLRDSPFDRTKERMESGTNMPCFVSEGIEKFYHLPTNSNNQEIIIKDCAAVSYLAGAETTANGILWWLLAMIRYPSVQARAYRELQDAIGTTRHPTFDDQPHLPYIQAMVSETLRWHPIAPLAVPHRVINDDFYDGYHIPAGATVIGNAWAILRDERVYPEPLEFKPERFLNAPGSEVPPDPATLGAFGFGRRICPGRHFALETLWLAMACILARFEIVGGEGERRPKPFKVRFVPRTSTP
ncbi:cytochrome P450 [Collybia nuda]|uniref:Cytochrome P450 n=1 Tax=Collybia nuda TaxID=64659 RepID=A0A9P6CIU4_9AGAR|nr:cytochrome P450 [Collybia nuda]